MHRSDDEYGRRHFRRQSRPCFSRDIDETLPSIPEDNGCTSDLLARSQIKPKNKVIKTWERKKLFSLKINRYVIFRMALLINICTSKNFVFLLQSGLDLTSSKLVTSCWQNPYGSKAYIGSRLDYLIWLEFKLVRDFMAVLVTCKFEANSIKSEGTVLLTCFPL